MKYVAFLMCSLLLPLLAPAQPTDSSTVRIFEDSRVAVLAGHVDSRPRYTGKARGFRVQIYNGTDRAQANRVKVDFLKAHADKRAYLIYHKPQFRVRVGDFPSRAAATAFSRQLSRKYNCMIVPDIVNVTPPKN